MYNGTNAQGEDTDAVLVRAQLVILFNSREHKVIFKVHI